jgi:L-malate glycosyltransferase
MKILWITNIIFPEVCLILKKPITITGGWMYGLAKLISDKQNLNLAVATTWNSSEFKEIEINKIKYYLLPVSHIPLKYNRNLEPFWKDVVNSFHPDLCHIHGTEFAHGLACMRACPELKYVVSIQGLLSVYSRYYYSGIKPFEIIKNITLQDLIKMDTIFHGKTKFKRRGGLEYEYIKTSKHVIGRTSWDLAHIKAINQGIRYHFCNEILRKSFYDAPKWDITKKVNNLIFISQAFYSVKGLHQVLKAIALLKSKYNTIKVRIAGRNIIRNKTFSDKIRLSGYGKYIKSLINNLNLNEQVTFTGPLNEEQMVEEYRKAHIYICPSSIENSPNSIGEAQILGTPCLASFVGGTPDMVVHGETGFLYRFEEIEMLAGYIEQVFSDDDLTKYLSLNEILAATKRHNKLLILEQTLKIYQNIISSQIDD